MKSVQQNFGLNLREPSRKRRLNAARHFIAAQAGSIAIEMALGFMITMTLTFGIMECCMMGYTYAVLENAVREGLRYAVVHGTDSTTCSGPSTGCTDTTGTNVASVVTNFGKTYNGALPGILVAVTYPDNASTPGSRVKVAISYTYQPVFHFPGTAHVLNVSSEGRILY